MRTLQDLIDDFQKTNTVKAPPRNPLVSGQAEMAKKIKAFLNKYETKKLGKSDSPWNRYGAGHEIGSLLFGESPELLDDMSYGLNPLTSGGRTGRIPVPDKRLLDMPIPTPSAGGLGVIKNKGQNWFTKSVENALKPLKRTTGAADYGDPIEQYPAINSWIDGPLTSYIKNLMATPEDPIRLRADKMAAAAKARYDKAVAKSQHPNDIKRAQERYEDEMSGVLHAEPPEEKLITGLRSDSGFPEEGYANTELGKQWETFTDNNINPLTAGERRLNSGGDFDKGFPELSMLSDETPVYQLYNRIGYSGFDHLIDEIGNALNPTSDLPANLRLTPEDLANPRRNSMESMVDMVAKINQHRRRMAIEAEKKSNEAIRDYPDWNVVKEYPDGYRMVRLPDVADSEEAFKIGKACGEKNGWCTKDDDALMRYGSRGSRLNLLLDPDGKPIAQVETGRIPHIDYDSFSDSEVELFRDSWPYPYDRPRGIHTNEEYEYYADGTYDAVRELFPDRIQYPDPRLNIKQIKGKFNQKPKAEHIPYLQDFVKSGNFSDIRELGNVDMYDMKELGYFSKEDFLSDPGFNNYMLKRAEDSGEDLNSLLSRSGNDISTYYRNWKKFGDED